MVKSRFNFFDFSMFIIFKIILDLTYIYLQNDLFGYYGFNLVIDFNRIFISWFTFIIMSIFFQTKDYSIKTILIYTFFLLSLTPCLVYYQFNPICELWMILSQTIFLVFMWLLFKIQFIKKNSSSFTIKKIPYFNKLLRITGISLIFLYFTYMVISYGMPSFEDMLFENIYESRAEVEFSTLLTVIQNLICKIICPIYILFAFKEKKYITFAFCMIVQIHSYGVSGFKTFLFIPLVLLGVNFLPKINLKKSILIGLPVVVLISNFSYLITKNNLIYSLFVERVLFLPAEIKVYYFDFFSKNQFLMFSQSTIGSIFGITSSYDNSIPLLIGELYFGKPDMWTNAGFMADAYANMGYFGMFIICTFIVLLFKFVDSQLYTFDTSLKNSLNALFLLFFISLNDGGAISVTFSGGLIFAVALIFLVDFKSKNNLYKNANFNKNCKVVRA